MQGEFISLKTAAKLKKYDSLMEHIENRILIILNKLKQDDKDNYDAGKLIGALKELELLKSILEVK